MNPFRLGDKVRIKGDPDDCTQHIDGQIGTVVGIFPTDIDVIVPGDPFSWSVWVYNAELVERESDTNAST